MAKSKVSSPAQELAEELMSLLELEATITSVTEDEIIKIQIDTPEPGLLIGFHGETLSGLEKILGLMLEKKTGNWQKITVNVGDYKERREETLKNLALNTAQRVKFSGQPWPLPPLSPSERRFVHMLLGDHPDVVTESEGEGVNRRIMVKPRVASQ
jgi:spoIIIJ-associated protein